MTADELIAALDTKYTALWDAIETHTHAPSMESTTAVSSALEAYVAECVSAAIADLRRDVTESETAQPA